MLEQQAYSYQQAANLLACSKDTIRRMCKDGRLHCIYLNKRTPRIPKWSLDRHLEVQYSLDYDGSRTTVSADLGEGVWQKFTKEKNRPVGGRRSKAHRAKELDALLGLPTRTH